MTNDFEKALKEYRPLEDTMKAKEYLSRICNGDRPSMQVPPAIDDYDMVFSRIIKKCEEVDRAALQAAIEQPTHWMPLPAAPDVGEVG